MLDGELSEAELEALRSHMTSCPACRAMFEAFSAVSGAVADEDEVPDSLHSGIMSRIGAAEKAMKTHGKLVRLQKTLLAAACFVVIVGTAFALKGSLFETRASEAASTAESMVMMTMADLALGESNNALDAMPAEEACTEAAEEDCVAATEESGVTGAPVPEPDAVNDSVKAAKEYSSADAGTVSDGEKVLRVQVTEYTETGFLGEVRSVKENFAANVSEGDSVEILADADRFPELPAVGSECTVLFHEWQVSEPLSVEADEIR